MIKKKISLCDLIYPVILAVLLFFKSHALYSKMDLADFPVAFSIATSAIFLAVFGLIALINVKAAKITVTVIYFIISVFMPIDSVYYEYMHKLPSAAQLGMAGQLDDVSDTISKLIHPADVMMLLDLPIWILYFFNRKMIGRKLDNSKLSGISQFFKKKFIPKIFAFLLALLLVALSVLALFLYPGFKAKYLENEIFCYHVRDFSKLVIKDKPQHQTEPPEDPRKPDTENTDTDAPDTGETDDTSEVIYDPKSPYISPDWSDGEFWGLAKDRNLIVIQVEALQNFLIGRYYEGQELTPTLNRLISNDSFYFENYYYQIGGGNTADAEFAVNNSLFAPDSTCAYVQYPDNDYYGLPYLLKDSGYSTATVFHGYIESFWGRSAAYPKQGFDDFISLEDLDPSDSFNMGLSDRQLFKQSMEYLVKYEEPFYSFYITLSSHHPYGIPLYEREITLKPEDEQTLFGLYLQAANYADRCIGEFIDMLDEAGLYENSMIVIYGDHYALHNADDANQEKVAALIGRQYDIFDLFNVPLIINIPGSGVTRTVSTAGGHIDALPTMLYLLGIHNDKSIMFGQNLIEAKKGFVCEQTHVSIGSFISDDVFYKKPHNNIEANYAVYERGTMRKLDFHLYEDQSDYAARVIADCAQFLAENDVLID